MCRSRVSHRSLAASPDDPHFVIQHGWHFELRPTVPYRDGRLLFAHEQLEILRPHRGGQLNLHPQRPDGDEFVHRLAPSPSAGQIDEMKNQMVFLPVKMAVNQAGTFDRKRDPIVGRPADQVCE